MTAPGRLTSATRCRPPNQWPTAALIDWLGILHRMYGIPDQARWLDEANQILRSRHAWAGTTLKFSTEQDDFWWWLMDNADANVARLILTMLDDPAWRADLPRLVVGYSLTRSITAVTRKDPVQWSRGDGLRIRLGVDAHADMSWVVVSYPVPAGATDPGIGRGLRFGHRHPHRARRGPSGECHIRWLARKQVPLPPSPRLSPQCMTMPSVPSHRSCSAYWRRSGA